jgi:thiol-disulfide isomerase/thioredoxin
MPSFTPTTAGALVLAVTLALAGCAGEDTAADAPASPASTAASPAAPPVAEPSAAETPAEPDATVAQATPGAWVDLAAYEADPAAYHDTGDVVLFFNADWCPTCQATVASLDADGVPDGLTVVSVDFDDSDALRQRYGVTVQHTYVQVDADGQELATFTGSLTGADIAASTV